MFYKLNNHALFLVVAHVYGTVFAVSPKTAIDVAIFNRRIRPMDTNVIIIIIAKVITGLYREARKDDTLQPYLGDKVNHCYNSVVNNNNRPTLFVTNGDCYAFPLYIVEFTL